MSIIKSIPMQRVIAGKILETSESIILSDRKYSTNGEYTIIVKSVDYCELYLNHETTDHVVIKALTDVFVYPAKGRIDEEFDNVHLKKGACAEFKFISDHWYILSSDGLKNN